MDYKNLLNNFILNLVVIKFKKMKKNQLMIKTQEEKQ